eukprot:TRINITY_DN7980_c0_g1_i1.p1 TRINITY_DN7980_c0_g1~~TRINITY_DN7980_c0_g1_i1.p1  ORF type:complete len:171 (+),score=58.70 TRINITY_DN7980_c0_g1_i1:45-515(+)
MADPLKEIFNKFCAFGGGKGAVAEMDNAKFAKFCRDTKLLDKKFTATDADLIFAKAKAKGERKLKFAEFKGAALTLVAEKKGVAPNALLESICNAGGPTSSGTKADAVKFHDDKSLYTGVYANGGPSTVDRGHDGLAGIVSDHDALTADIRGVVQK